MSSSSYFRDKRGTSQRILLLSILVSSFFGFLSCSEDENLPSSPDNDSPRALALAAPIEIFGQIFLNGQILSNPAGYSIQLQGQGTSYGGSHTNRTIIINPGTQNPSVTGCTAAGCSNFGYDDGFRPSGGATGLGKVWNGKYIARLTRPGHPQCSSAVFAHNGLNNASTNGNFLDQSSGDLTIKFNLTTSGGCNVQIIGDDGGPGHSKSATALTSSISAAPSTVGVGQVFTVVASSSGGFAKSTHRYAWDFQATGGTTSGSQEDFAGASFSAFTTATHSYNQIGTYKIRVLVRDGNDLEYGGGNYALSSPVTVTVVDTIGDDASALTNFLPSSMGINEIRSVTVEMENTGTNTWTTSAGYRLDLHRDGVWSPLSDALTASVSPGQEHTFFFDLQPQAEGTFACFYRMIRAGFFGEENGRNITVTSGGGFGLTAGEASNPQPLGTKDLNPESWITDARLGGSQRLVLEPRSDGLVVFGYKYNHAKARALDVVIRFKFDPSIHSPAPLNLGPTVRLSKLEDLGTPGEYWARLQGTVPAGEGLIATFPFLNHSKGLPADSVGTVTLYYPSR